MSINQRQFEQLTEMGITLWQHRTCDNDNANEKVQTPHPHYIDIDLNALANQPLFNDILLSTGLSIGEISQQDNHLNLGLFNWYFTALSSQNNMQWLDQQLITPTIDEISKSPALKKQLWQLLSKEIAE